MTDLLNSLPTIEPFRDSIIKVPSAWQKEFGRAIYLGKQGKNIQINLDVIPNGQTWTDLNMNASSSLYEKSLDYRMRGITNGTLLTLQACEWRPYNTPAIDIERASLRGERLSSKSLDIDINLGEVTYFEHLSYMDGVRGVENPMAVIVSVICETSDGKLAFTERGQSSSTGQGKIGCIGGTYNKEVVKGEKGVPFPQLLAASEIKEEVGLSDSHSEIIESLNLESLIFDNLGRPVLVFKYKSKHSSQEMEKMFSDSPEATAENRKLVFIDYTREAILSFMEQSSPEKFHEPADSLLTLCLNDKYFSGDRITPDQVGLMIKNTKMLEGA